MTPPVARSAVVRDFRSAGLPRARLLSQYFEGRRPIKLLGTNDKFYTALVPVASTYSAREAPNASVAATASRPLSPSSMNQLEQDLRNGTRLFSAIAKFADRTVQSWGSVALIHRVH